MTSLILSLLFYKNSTRARSLTQRISLPTKVHHLNQLESHIKWGPSLNCRVKEGVIDLHSIGVWI